MAKPDVSPVAVAAAVVGLVFLWSGIKGASVLASVQQLILGQRPTWKKTNPIGLPSSGSGSGSGSSAPTSSALKQAVCASMYGGPTDPSSGTHGYHGDTLTGTMAFAELKMGTALGGLPYKTQIRIEYKGKAVVATKLDIGAGGPGCGGYQRGIDLWWQTAAALGFDGLDVVTYEVI
jgi:hypothetical protein